MASYTGADETLDLLVLWRGTPGWFAKGGRSGSSGGGRSGGAQQHRFYEGAYEFEVTLDRTTGKAHVLDRDIDVATANAVFVDEVDASRGPRIAKTMLLTNRTLDTTLRGPNQIVALMGKIPEVREYVGCETRLPDERLQARLAPMCALLMKPPVTSR
jgi:hypothetical protein